MRRVALKALLSAALPILLPSVAEGSPIRSHAYDERLFGTWRSDKERTLAHWQFKDGIDPKAKETIAGWFGRLTLTFSRSKVITFFEGSRFESRYRVLARTDNSATVEYVNEGRAEIETIYLAEGYMFKRVGTSKNFEYFSRVAA